MRSPIGPTGALLVAVAVGVTLWFARELGIALHPVVVPLSIAVAGVLLSRGRATIRPLSEPWAPPDRVLVRTTHDRQLSSLTLMVHGLRGGRTWERLAPQLVQLVDHRLLAHHGVDRAADPDAAHALLAPELRSLVAHPDTPVDRHTLRTIISRIEEL